MLMKFTKESIIFIRYHTISRENLQLAILQLAVVNDDSIKSRMLISIFTSSTLIPLKITFQERTR